MGTRLLILIAFCSFGDAFACDFEILGQLVPSPFASVPVISRNGKYILSTKNYGKTGALTFVERPGNPTVNHLSGGGEWISAGAISDCARNCGTVAIANVKNEVRLFNVRGGKLLDADRHPIEIPQHKRQITQLHLTPNGKTLITVSGDRLAVFDLNSGRFLRWLNDPSLTTADADAPNRRNFRVHRGGVEESILGDDGRRVVTLGKDGEVKVWAVNPSSAKTRFTKLKGLPEKATTIAINGINAKMKPSDGIAAGDSLGNLTIWRRHREPVQRLKHDKSIRTVEFSKDGKNAMFLDRDGKLHRGDIETGRISARFGSKYTPAATTLKTYTQKNIQLAVTGHSDGSVRIWSLRSQEPLETIEPADRVIDVAIEKIEVSQQLGRILVSSKSGTRVFRVPIGKKHDLGPEPDGAVPLNNGGAAPPRNSRVLPNGQRLFPFVDG